MNRVVLVGRLTKDTEIKLTSNQSKLCMFTIAVDRRFKDKDGNRQADFINCLAWGKNAEFIGKYFKKGSKIAVVGSIQTRTYADKDGKTVYVTEVVVDEAEFVESISNGEAKTETKAEAKAEVNPSSGEMPFEI